MKIVFLEPIGMQIEEIREQCQSILSSEDELIIFPTRTEDEAELIHRAQGAEVVVVSNIRLSKFFFQSIPTLRLLSVAFAGVDHIDLDACKAYNVIVKNAAGYSTHAVAELTLGMILDSLRNIHTLHQDTRNGKDRAGFLGSELRGKCIGIVGMGAIGQEVARLAHAFGCRVIAYNRSHKEMDNVEFYSLDEVCKHADILTLHLPLTKETTHLITEHELSLMKPTSLFVNTARGGIIDSDALYNALKNGKIAGAALDVYNQEPPLSVNDKFLHLNNVLTLPHIGYATKEAFNNRLQIMIENIKNYKSEKL